ncbi:MAG: hypothetical protein C0606_13250 [Hyphomicrobiales bacterium]|nr:MAG: hypothetical protein C0606_13250 [Hyphomicrobiales bacterium]
MFSSRPFLAIAMAAPILALAFMVQPAEAASKFKQQNYGKVKAWRVHSAWRGDRFLYCTATRGQRDERIRIAFDGFDWFAGGRNKGKSARGYIRVDNTGKSVVFKRNGPGWQFVRLSFRGQDLLRRGREIGITFNGAEITGSLNGSSSAMLMVEECAANYARARGGQMGEMPRDGAAMSNAPMPNAPMSGEPREFGGPAPDASGYRDEPGDYQDEPGDYRDDEADDPQDGFGEEQPDRGGQDSFGDEENFGDQPQNEPRMQRDGNNSGRDKPTAARNKPRKEAQPRPETAAAANTAPTAGSACEGGEQPLPVTGLCPSEAQEGFLSAGDNRYLPMPGCKWVVNETEMHGGEVLIYLASSCKTGTAKLEFAPGAKTFSVKSSDGDVDITGITVDSADGLGSIESFARDALGASIKADACGLRDQDDGYIFDLSKEEVERIAKAEEYYGGGNCGPYGYNGDGSHWRDFGGYGWYIRLGQDAYFSIEPSSLRVIQYKDDGNSDSLKGWRIKY